MAGGIYDHIGGGFARYSVDGEWHVPHFEKMLYDNAQLISLYSEAYQITQDERYKRVVYETINWLDREMRGPERGASTAHRMLTAKAWKASITFGPKKELRGNPYG